MTALSQIRVSIASMPAARLTLWIQSLGGADNDTLVLDGDYSGGVTISNVSDVEVFALNSTVL